MTIIEKRALSLVVAFSAAMILFVESVVGQPIDAGDRATPAPLAAELHETVARIPIVVELLSGQKYNGEFVVTSYRPASGGPFPTVILNHGRSAAKRGQTPRFRSITLARYWTRRGFAVFVPTRIGYGDSGTEVDPEHSGARCGERNYDVGVRAAVDQITATWGYAKSHNWVDATRLIVVGQSYGGLAAVAAGGRVLDGLLAVINFAGGAGGDPLKYPGRPCAPEAIQALLADQGAKSKLPMLWLYAVNDKYWGAEWPRRWHAAYNGTGGRAELNMLPPVGDDGHKLLNAGRELWRPIVDDFIQRIGFKSPN